MSALIVIPSRYGSTRFPGKPLALIDGVSLIQRVHERARQSGSASLVCVATDDSRIAEHVSTFGGTAVMTSPDHATGTDRIHEASLLMRERTGTRFDLVVNVQGDEPLIDMSRVDALIELMDSSDTDVATLCSPITSAEEFLSRDVVKVVSAADGTALYFSRSPIPFDGAGIARRHIGVYAYRFSILEKFVKLRQTPLELCESLEQLRLLENGFRIRVVETSRPHLGVDRPDDIPKIEEELRRQHSVSER